VSEIELIQRACRGDQAAWSRLLQMHQLAVYRLAYLWLADADEAGDITQEVFVRTFRTLDRLDPSLPLRPWLLRVTTNLVRNRHRYLKRYLAALVRWWQAEAEPAEPPPGDTLAGQWEAKTLWLATRRLSPPDQEIIYLRYFLELSIAETAQVTSLAPGTVKSRLHRALSRLRTVIEREFPELQEERVK
jgi:RNA polymerase sigma-70 factor (ECF subfamily)